MSRMFAVGTLVLMLAAVAGGTAWYMLSRGMSADLSVIGEGRPVAVLVYENHSPTSMQAFDRLTAVRDAFAGQLEFRLALTGTPQGEAFAERYGVPQGTLVLFDGRGAAISASAVPVDPAELIKRLESALPGDSAQ